MITKIESGNEADIYLDGTIFKLFKNKLTGLKSAEVEYSILRFLDNNSFPVPKPIGIYEEDERAGVKMTFIPGPTLQDDFFQSGHGLLVGKLLAVLHYKLHNISTEKLPTNLPNVKDLFEKYAKASGMSELLSSLPEGKAILAHGDFHPANIISNPNGKIVIDWSRAFIGPAEADIATTLVLLMIVEPPSDATDLEKEVFEINIVDCQQVYLQEYMTLLQLDRVVVEQWVTLVAARYKKNKKLVDLAQGKLKIPWP